MIKFELCLEELLYTKSRVRDPAGSGAQEGSRETQRGKGPDVSELQGAQTTHEARRGWGGVEGVRAAPGGLWLPLALATFSPRKASEGGFVLTMPIFPP